MKTFISLLSCFLIGFMFACQPVTEVLPEPEIPELPEPEPPKPPEPEIPQYMVCEEDAERLLSHEPTRVVDVETKNQTVKIDFSLDENIVWYISYKGTHYYDCDSKQLFKENLFDAYPTLGKLAGYYSSSKFGYQLNYSSNYPPEHFNGNIVYTQIEYALAQECLRDDCCTMTRKAILQMVVDKHKPKIEPFLFSYQAQRTGMFLMAVILVMEKDVDFLTAILEKPDLQNVLSLNLDYEIVMNQITTILSYEFDLAMCQFANNFLKNNL